MSEQIKKRVPFEELPEWYKRLETESSELHDRVVALEKFINEPNATYTTLDNQAQSLLRAQLGAMTAYREILRVRILKIRIENNY